MLDKQQYFCCILCYRNLTVDPHIAGSDRNDELAHDLMTQWNSYGFDSVNIYNYTVLLTFPNKSRFLSMYSTLCPVLILIMSCLKLILL